MNPLSGIILVDKPQGLTSARVVARLKRKFSLEKIGHAGTLDPLATGLLIVLCGKAAKLQEFFLGETKAYRGEIRLGFSTNSDDITGEIQSDQRGGERFAELSGSSKTELNSIAARLIEKFSGSQSQIPPQVSAIKVDGKRAYKSARQGQIVEMAQRQVFVSELELEFCAPGLLRYFVRCSKGYYVRALARDIGMELGTGGAIETLRRVESNPFRIEQAASLEAIEASAEPGIFITPIEQLPLGIPRFEISREIHSRLCRGDQRPLIEFETKGGERAASLFIEGSEFGGIVEREDGAAFKIRFLV